MKNTKNIILLVLTLLVNIAISKTSSNFDQDTETITGVFDGFDGESYSFNHTNDDDEEDVLFFSKIDLELLKKYDLSDEKFIGKTFTVTFISETITEIDEDGDEQEYDKRTIVGLELLE